MTPRALELLSAPTTTDVERLDHVVDCRRAIRADEVPHLRAVGVRVRELRRGAGLTQRQLARGVLINAATVSRLENGLRRSRASTLRALVEVLVSHDPNLGPADDLLDELVALAGPSLAPESPWRGRIERRRVRRHRPEPGATSGRGRGTASSPRSPGTRQDGRGAAGRRAEARARVVARAGARTDAAHRHDSADVPSR